MKGYMRIATFQFEGSGNLDRNFDAIMRAIELASKKEARVLLTQECALCGYPPIETASVDAIDFADIDEKISVLKKESLKRDMFLAIGTITKQGNTYQNSVVILSPEKEEAVVYSKRAMWGWDLESFIPGTNKGIFEVDNIKIGVRICYETRFPELFRELYKEKVQIALISFCDNKDADDVNRYELMKYTVVNRSIENVMYTITSNSISKYQTAPTMIVDPDGKIQSIASRDKEELLVCDIDKIDSTFGRDGISFNNNKLLSI